MVLSKHVSQHILRCIVSQYNSQLSLKISQTIGYKWLNYWVFGFFDPNVAEALLEAGANANATDTKGETALMKSSGFGFKQSVSVLIQHHVDVNLKDAKGRTHPLA